MAQLPIQLNLRNVRVTENLDKVFYEVIQEDMYKALQYTAAIAINEQLSIGNPLTSLLVDGRPNRYIDTAQKRIRAFFFDGREVYKAFTDAVNLISTLVPRRSGRAAFSYEFWCNEKPVGKDLSRVEAFTRTMGPQDYVRIVGPTLVYGRKVNYNPGGIKRFSRRTVVRTKSFLVKKVKVQGIMERVQNLIGRRYSGLYVKESWVKTNDLPKDGRTPGIVIGVSKRGKLRGA